MTGVSHSQLTHFSYLHSSMFTRWVYFFQSISPRCHEIDFLVCLCHFSEVRETGGPLFLLLIYTIQEIQTQNKKSTTTKYLLPHWSWMSCKSVFNLPARHKRWWKKRFTKYWQILKTAWRRHDSEMFLVDIWTTMELWRSQNTTQLRPADIWG